MPKRKKKKSHEELTLEAFWLLAGAAKSTSDAAMALAVAVHATPAPQNWNSTKLSIASDLVAIATKEDEKANELTAMAVVYKGMIGATRG